MTVLTRVCVFAISAAVLFAGQSQPVSQPDVDLAIFKTVLRETIRPAHVERRGAKGRDERIAVFDHTMAWCKESAFDRWALCLPTDDIRLSVPPQPNNEQVFGDHLSVSDRIAIAADFSARNQRSVRLPKWSGPEITLIDQNSLRRQSEAGSSVTYAGFSQPGYVAPDRAVVYVYYHCANLCAYSWLVLLRKGAGAWEVEATKLISMS